MSRVVHSIVVQKDVGHYEPRYESVYLELHEDGSTTWRPLEQEKIRGGDHSIGFDGSRIPAKGWT